ncbi:hypothetical protein ACT0JV_002687 [Listeria monocytogenes]
MIIENDIENYLIRQVKKRNGLCLKWTSPGNAGVPDRIVMNNKHIFFIELKKQGKSLAPCRKFGLKS